MISEGSSATFETTQVVGVTLPSDVKPGDSWSQTFNITGIQTLPDGKVADSQGTATSNYTAIGLEMVTVPAGSFEALRVEVDFGMEVEITMEGISVPFSMTSSGPMWYAEGVGWVRSESIGTLFGETVDEILVLDAFSLAGD